MKRSWEVILAAAMLAGCRSSQPATNPFLRTTVPPPGTGQGMMVMPGELAATPPVVTTPIPPPPVSTAVPVTPVPGQPVPLIAPPPVTPKQEEFHPPGGSYQYHQSSNDRPGADSMGVEAQVQLAATQVRESSTVRFQAASQFAASPGSRVLRMTAGAAASGGTSSQHGAGGAGSSQIAIVTPSTVSRPSAAVDRPMGAVTQTAFQPVATSDYAHSRDYGTLRGRLEYSQSSRQWKLRYIPINGQTDTYGGSVVLSDIPSLKPYAPGDMVAVNGSLAAGIESSGFSPRYEIHAIEPLSR